MLRAVQFLALRANKKDAEIYKVIIIIIMLMLKCMSRSRTAWTILLEISNLSAREIPNYVHEQD